MMVGVVNEPALEKLTARMKRQLSWHGPTTLTREQAHLANRRAVSV
ncbi:hypothetical protein HNR34_003351 [Geobacillus subterraneus]